MEEINWKLASNSQLEEESNRLQEEFKKKQLQMMKIYDEMSTISRIYNEINGIINTRQGMK